MESISTEVMLFIVGPQRDAHWSRWNGNTVRISGYEEWIISAKGLIAESKGHFDEAEYQRQLNKST
jgi:hypothetical protein